MSIYPNPSTLRDVARTAGVSETAVSHILHGKGRFSQTTRDRVRGVAETMGYRPNLSARAMVTGRFGVLALLLANDHSKGRVHAGILDGIQDALKTHGMHVMVERLPARNDLDQLPQLLSSIAVDGYLVNWHVNIPSQLIDSIRAMPQPAIWINHKYTENAVCPDDEDLGYQAAATLITEGHRRIAFVSFNHLPGIPGEHFSQTDRYTGYERAMTAHGLEPMPLGGDWHIIPAQDRLTWCQSVLTQANPPSAVIGYGKNVMYEMVAAAQVCQVSVPKDITLLALMDDLNDYLRARGVRCQSIPFREVGIQAVQQVLQRIELGGQTLPTTMVRGSGEIR